MGLVEGWQLALVVLAVAPLLAIVGGVMMKFMRESSSKSQIAYSVAGAIADEVRLFRLGLSLCSLFMAVLLSAGSQQRAHCASVWR